MTTLSTAPLLVGTSAALVFGLSSFAPASELKSDFVASGTSANLIFYPAACPAFKAASCVLVDFTCSEYGDLSMGLAKLSHESLGRWIQANGGRATVAAGNEALEFWIVSILQGEAGWNATLKPARAAEEISEVLAELGDRDKIEISTGTGEVVLLPDGSRNLGRLRAVVSACTPEL
jgi:hypothetical protein